MQFFLYFLSCRSLVCVTYRAQLAVVMSCGVVAGHCVRVRRGCSSCVRFPEVFDCIVKVGSNNDIFYEDDVFPSNKCVTYLGFFTVL